MVALGWMSSRQSSLIASCWKSEPPNSSRGSKPFLSHFPARVTVIEPVPPTGLLWQEAQLDWLKIGPKPVASVKSCMKESLPISKRTSSERVSPSSGSPTGGCKVTGPAPAETTTAPARTPRPMRIDHSRGCLSPGLCRVPPEAISSFAISQALLG